MVDVGQLRAVKRIAEAGSITAAAKELGMSQPGLSRLVERVEDEFDANLFLRGRNGAVLTADGRKFMEFARSTLNGYDMLRASVSGNRRSKRGSNEPLRLVASTTPGEYLLPRIASEFTERYDGISVETLITDSAGVANLLMTGEYDVGFAGQKSDYGTLHYVKITRDEIVLVVPISHRFASSDEIDVSQLEGEKILHRENGSGTYETVKAVLQANGSQLPSAPASISLGSTQALLSAVDAGVGIGFVTLRAIEHHAPTRVTAVRIVGTPVMRDLYIVYEPDRKISENAQTFIDYVEQLEIDKST